MQFLAQCNLEHIQFAGTIQSQEKKFLEQYNLGNNEISWTMQSLAHEILEHNVILGQNEI